MGRFSRPWRKVAISAMLLVGVIGWRSGEEMLSRYRFGLNLTDSLPHWAFITDTTQRVPARGDLVEFVPPTSRFYPAGQSFVKRVVGVPGDEVVIKGDVFFVAGVEIGVAKTVAQDGSPVEWTTPGRLPPGAYFMAGESQHSLDSRYELVGWVQSDQIIGIAESVL